MRNKIFGAVIAVLAAVAGPVALAPSAHATTNCTRTISLSYNGGFVGSQIAGSWSPVGGWSGYWPQCPAGSGGGDATVVISGNPAATYCTAVMTLNASNWL